MYLTTAIVLFAGIAVAQTNEPAFEVASIKPHRSETGRVQINLPDPGRMLTENTSLKMLIRFAYDLPFSRIAGGEGWMDSDRWNVEAKTDRPIPRTPEGQVMIRGMMKRLLADRFHLVVREETKEMPVYALLQGKDPAKLKLLLVAPDETQATIRTGAGTISATKISLAQLARSLTDGLGSPVTDETGLAGTYTFQLEFAPEGSFGPRGDGDAAPVTDRPALTTALQEKLGLKLESRKGPLKIVVIDKAEKPTEN